MYRTPNGVRILASAEARLFVESLAMLVDLLADGDCASAIGPFDELQRNQKIALLHTVGHALLRSDMPAPALTAAIEAAVAAVYRHVEDMIQLEIEEPANSARRSWRQMVLDACRETDAIDKLPKSNSAKMEDWSGQLACLEQLVLWDTDWALQSSLDADPQVTQRLKGELGIDDDYYVAVAPDPSDSQAERLLAELRLLTAIAR